jgi:hypothetical protein
MPDSQVLNLMAAGWPNPAKVHLMIAYLQEAFNKEEDKLKALIFYGSFRNATSRTSRMLTKDKVEEVTGWQH